MKSLVIFAISTLFIVGYSSNCHSQGWKDKLGLKKTGKAYAKDMTEEEIDGLVGWKKPDDGVNTDYHKAHLNEVVFSTEALEPNQVNASKIKTTFGINDPISLNVLLPKSTRNYVVYSYDENGNIQNNCYYDYSFKKWYAEKGNTYRSKEGKPTRNDGASSYVIFTIDGKVVDYILTLGVNTNSPKTIYSNWIIVNTMEAEPNKKWAPIMNNLSDGEHEVKLVVYAGKATGTHTEHPIAEGSFTLVKKPGEKYAPKFAKGWSDFAATDTDATLTSKVLTAAQQYIKTNEYDEQITNVKITGGWWITRHALTGVILTRYLSALCYEEWPDGSCRVREYKFVETYDGNNYQSTPYCSGAYKYGGGGENGYTIKPQTINCE